ncbi:hypothetical protein AB1K70_03295 [Bremerella sp. JC770]|uniref:hypothetical protein n=1 Tax=Bremerella sp. JC770 TaxID=3232137 RepID=UPI00345B25AE
MSQNIESQGDDNLTITRQQSTAQSTSTSSDDSVEDPDDDPVDSDISSTIATKVSSALYEALTLQVASSSMTSTSPAELISEFNRAQTDASNSEMEFGFDPVTGQPTSQLSQDTDNWLSTDSNYNEKLISSSITLLGDLATSPMDQSRTTLSGVTGTTSFEG